MTSNVEVELAKWVGQAGGAGMLMYILIRFGPVIETLLRGAGSKRDNGTTKHEYPDKARSSRDGLTWETLVTHCDRTHKAADELAKERNGTLEKAVDGLRTDLKEGLKDLGARIDKRNGGV